MEKSINKMIKSINDLLKPIGLEADSVYKSSNGYIVSGCLIRDPEIPLDDCLFLYDDKTEKIREYGYTESPIEFTKALNNPVYYRD